MGGPKNSYYMLLTILNIIYPTTLALFLFKIPTHCQFNNIFFNNCRCIGMIQSAMKDMLVSNCEFTHCGRSGANCAYDAENGWDMMQDVTFKRLNFYNNPANEFLTRTGHNFILEDQVAGAHHFYKRTHEYVIRNCSNTSKAYYESGDIATLGIPRIIKNNFSTICNAIGITIKNCTEKIINGNVINSNLTYIGTGKFKDCTFTFNDVDIPYLSACNLNNCTIQTKSSDITANLRFNNENRPFIFNNCIFKNKTYLNPNNNFSNANFISCEFEDLSMNVMVSATINLITFDKCIINTTTHNQLISTAPFAYSIGISNLIFNNCKININSTNSQFKLIYAYSKVKNSTYLFTNCKINQPIGTIFEWYPGNEEKFDTFYIFFESSSKINVPYSTQILYPLFQDNVFIQENNSN